MVAPLSARLPLSRSALDRDYLGRACDDLFERLRANPATRALILLDGQALLTTDGTELALLPATGLPVAELELYLGRSVADPHTPFIAATFTPDSAAVFGSAARWGNLRVLGAELDDLQAGLFTEALALANWHDAHAFSPKTGAATEPALGGWVRRADDGDLFPRTDAAIIVGITDAHDRILLGSNSLWAANRFSLLAGFVEPGESLEAAVVREVFEESGVRVVDPVYVGSQPWPFPASLMLGFRATVAAVAASAPTPDGQEIRDLRWFSRADLAAALPHIALPGRTSIARAILEDWYGGPIADEREW